MRKILFAMLIATVYAATVSADGLDDAYSCPHSHITPSMVLNFATLAPIAAVESQIGCTIAQPSAFIREEAALGILMKTYTSRDGEIVVAFINGSMDQAAGAGSDGVSYIRTSGWPSAICTGMGHVCTPAL